MVLMREAERGIGSDESGQALVELLFALPILLVILFGIVEFANAWRTSELVTNAAREGSRRAVAAGSSNSESALRSQVKQIVDRVGLDSAAATVTFTCPDESGNICSDGSGHEQVVTVDYTYDWIVLGPIMELLGSGKGDGYQGSITITGVSSMRTE